MLQKTLILILGVICLSSFANAHNTAAKLVKEPELILNTDTHGYPINVHYKFYYGKIIFGQGDINNLQSKQKQYIDVNQIPKNSPVTIQLDKINIANRTVINDPCQTTLKANQLKASITINFKGNPYTHGSFECEVSPKQYPSDANELP